MLDALDCKRSGTAVPLVKGKRRIQTNGLQASLLTLQEIKEFKMCENSFII